jgi:hypothetical protein
MFSPFAILYPKDSMNIFPAQLAKGWSEQEIGGGESLTKVMP